MQNKEKLERLKKEVSRCKKCSLWKTRKNTVFGEGFFNSKTIIIGQAPGAEEDSTGRPFIGRSGQLLTKILSSAGIKRENVFITSPLKCFPPQNRKPSKEELEKCLPYLQKQIGIINPKKYILLGDVALKTFFFDKRLSNLRGKIIKKDGRRYFISYHPAAGIRFKKFKKIIERDFKKLSKYF